jgi:D-beta-D-heptose 7-phosphate kinase/D-beta-D-heptose 1-phosphate adenosyltransferase
MTPRHLATIDAFARLRVLVLGEAMLDSYLVGEATRLCQEAPVPVVAVQQRRDQPGGAANTAANLAALGCQVELLSVVGDDAEGKRLRELLRARRVGIEEVLTQAGRRTLAKQRVMAGVQLVVRFDQGDTDPVAPAVERELVDRLVSAHPCVDAIVVSDYSYGVMTPAIIERLAALQARRPAVVAVDARDLLAYRSGGVTLLKPNYDEAVRLLGPRLAGVNRTRAEVAETAGRMLLEWTNSSIVAVTMDRDGAIVVERGCTPHRTFARPAEQVCAAGAGDTFIAAFALALASGGPTPVAADLAAAAASVVVTRDGTATCTADDVRRVIFGGPEWPHNGRANGAQVSVRGRRPLSDEEGADDVTDLGERRTPALHPA